MKVLAVFSVVVAAARAGYLGGDTSLGGDSGHSVFTAPAAVSYGHAAAPVGVSYGGGFGAVGGGALLAAPVATSFVGGPIAAAAPLAPRLHEIHTHNARPVIRLEEFSQGGQIIRVHEAPQAPPQILRLQAPGEPQSVIRVISKSSGPAHVERVLHQATGAQVIDVQKPGPAPARIVQVVRGPSLAPRVEFIQEPEVPSVHVAHAPAIAPLPAPIGGPALGLGPGLLNAGPIAVAGPAPIVAAAPLPIIAAAPAISYAPAPISHAAAIPIETKIIKKYHH